MTTTNAVSSPLALRSPSTRRRRTVFCLAALMVGFALKSTAVLAAPVCGDVNESGDVTTSDALAVLRRAVGQPISLLCPDNGQPLVTGQTTSYGDGSDGDLQIGRERSFLDNGDGTITDVATGLMWEKKSNVIDIHGIDNVYTWTTGTTQFNGTLVTEFLAGLNAGDGFAGYNDWRIPNRFELETLVNLEVLSPATHPKFHLECPPGTTVLTGSCINPSGTYWTSSSYSAPSTLAWYIAASDGFANAASKGESRHARAVRGGN